MIDLSQLTQEQRWGLSFATMKYNEGRGGLSVTDQEYADAVLRSACDSYYDQLIQRKTELAIQQFEALSPEQQVAFLTQLQVPDIVQ